MKKEFDLLQSLLDTEFKPEKDVPMRRFGEQASFRIRALDGKDIQRIRQQAMYPTKNGEKLDEEKFGTLLIVKACVNPDWSDRRLLEGLGVSDPTEAVQKRLLSGEIAKLTAAILDLSGFGEDAEDDVKN
ncbi:phage tail assembly chaperone [Brevibacillus thermoruber]|uniref:phage tail assembly chaperone n=1 Tax=Brevibacillus thermoruber TaxID=33942 RepID=UPI0004287857|nr:hypothetical protein [Brevibacillus thermoruber]